MRIMSILTLTILLVVALPLALFAVDVSATSLPDAHWIWHSSAKDKLPARVHFRKSFELQSVPVAASMQLAADDKYKVWINGILAAETANDSADPGLLADTFDATKLLQQGENLVVAQVYNREGPGAFLAYFAIRTADGSVIRINTDSSWEASVSLGEDWQKTESSGDWVKALDLGAAATTPPWYCPRTSTDLLNVAERSEFSLSHTVISPVSVKLLPDTTVSVARFTDKAEDGPLGAAFAEPTEPGQKMVILVDFGKEVVGSPILVGHSYGAGKITVACGEYANECDNPAQPVAQEVYDAGGIRFITPARYAFRYAKFTVEPEHILKIGRIQAEVVGYPVTDAGEFESSDSMLNEIWSANRNTLQCVMSDYYQTGPKLDRYMRLADLRLAALSNYYVLGNTSLTKRSLIKFGDLMLPNGLIPATGPEMKGEYIPDMSAYWVIALADYYHHTGDEALVKLLYPQVQLMMNWFQANTGDDGLVVFDDEMSSKVFIDAAPYLQRSGRITAVQALYYWALNNASELAGVARDKRGAKVYKARAEQVRIAANSLLWDETAKAYVDSDSPEKAIHKQTNALAVISGLADDEKAQALADVLLDDNIEAITTPYMNYYVAAALFEIERSNEAISLVRNYWGGMIDRGATTFWEQFDSEWPNPYEKTDFSYCHSWSTGPGHLLPGCIAGIIPVEPNYKKITLKPQLGDIVSVKAEVPTLWGKIAVDWKSEQNCTVGSVYLPRGTDALVLLPQPPDNAWYEIDGKRIRYKLQDGRVAFTLGEGKSYKITLGTK